MSKQTASLRPCLELCNVNKEELNVDSGAGLSVGRAQLQVIMPESMHIVIRLMGKKRFDYALFKPRNWFYYSEGSGLGLLLGKFDVRLGIRNEIGFALLEMKNTLGRSTGFELDAKAGRESISGALSDSQSIVKI